MEESTSGFSLSGLGKAAAQIGLMIFGLLMSLVVLEILLRIVQINAIPSSQHYYLWLPQVNDTFDPLPSVMPGVEGLARFSINNEGMRATRNYNPDADEYQILAIGGSTTENLYLDQSETWTVMLEEMLGSTASGEPVFVGSVGRAGVASMHHVLTMELYTPQYPELDAAIVMVGVNDMSAVLEDAESFHPDRMNPRVDVAAKRADTFWTEARSGWQAMRLFDLMRFVIRIIEYSNAPVQDNAGELYIRAREVRQQAEIWLDTPPSTLPLALEQYESNLWDMRRAGDGQGLRMVFVTQPYIWSPQISPEAETLLWFGAVGWDITNDSHPRSYFTVEAMIETLDAFNARLLDFCAESGSECIDLAAEMSGNEDYFFDDVHFSEAGSARVAEILRAYFAARPPFK